MNFSQAKALLDQGKMVRQNFWDRDFFVFKQVPSEIPIAVVPKMTSLPQQVKDEFIRRSLDEGFIDIGCGSIKYDHQLAIVNDDNLISGYQPSVYDLESETWEEYSPQS